MKDYDVNFQYHLGKPNVVAAALSCRPYLTMNSLMKQPVDLCEELRKLELNVITPRAKSTLHAMEVQLTLIEEIPVAQTTDPQLEKIREEILVGKAPGFVIHEDGIIRFHNRVCVLLVAELKKKILDEGHNSSHLVHLGGNKLYKDLKQMFWWSNMKQEVVDVYLTCCSLDAPPFFRWPMSPLYLPRRY